MIKGRVKVYRGSPFGGKGDLVIDYPNAYIMQRDKDSRVPGLRLALYAWDDSPDYEPDDPSDRYRPVRELAGAHTFIWGNIVAEGWSQGSGEDRYEDFDRPDWYFEFWYLSVAEEV